MSSSKLISVCEQHEHEEVRFYCEDCKVMLCDDCITGPHKNCKFMKLKDFGVKRKTSLMKLIKDAEDFKMPDIETAIMKTSDLKTNFKNTIGEQIDLIRAKRNFINEILDEIQSELTDNFESEQKDAEDEFNRFIKMQRKRIADIKDVTESIKSKGTDISATDVAKFHVTLENLLEHDLYADTIPSMQPPVYHFNETLATKSKLQVLVGCMESGTYAIVDSVKVPRVENLDFKKSDTVDQTKHPRDEDQGDSYVDTQPWSKHELQTQRFFNTEKEIAFIVPKNKELCAWIVEKYIAEADCTGTNVNVKYLKTLDQQPLTAGTNTKDEIVIGFRNKRVLKQLQVSTSMVTRKTQFSLAAGVNIGDLQLCCISKTSMKEDEILLCLSDSSGKYIIRWHSNGKSVVRELPLVPGKVDIMNPIQICENVGGYLCFLCRSENESWVLVVNKFGEQQFRYPQKDDPKMSTERYDIVGAGFLSNGTVTISNRSTCEQQLLSLGGQCIQRDNIYKTPVCSAADDYDNIWIVFLGGLVKVMHYSEEHLYSSMDGPTVSN